ncbi:MAG: beta-hydroxyacyl-ACP dehydratase [Bacteriovoracaceae bacterium]|nr:beta-hydroxyacyl-ACP dehydratase [Bacteriovoracaceae bacterium]
MASQEVLDAIPQRPPFLFLDEILERGENSIICKKNVTGNEDFFKGHFPGNPIMPGVLLQETCFQAGAALMSTIGSGGLGVVSKVEKAKFKGMVRPGDELMVFVSLAESLGNAYYFKGKITVLGKTVMAINFTCALLEG